MTVSPPLDAVRFWIGQKYYTIHNSKCLPVYGSNLILLFACLYPFQLRLIVIDLIKCKKWVDDTHYFPEQFFTQFFTHFRWGSMTKACFCRTLTIVDTIVWSMSAPWDSWHECSFIVSVLLLTPVKSLAVEILGKW